AVALTGCQARPPPGGDVAVPTPTFTWYGRLGQSKPAGPTCVTLPGKAGTANPLHSVNREFGVKVSFAVALTRIATPDGSVTPVFWYLVNACSLSTGVGAPPLPSAAPLSGNTGSRSAPIQGRGATAPSSWQA